MNANIVYEIVKALSQEEQGRLFTMLAKNIHSGPSPRKKKRALITKAESDAFIFRNVFCKKR